MNRYESAVYCAIVLKFGMWVHYGSTEPAIMIKAENNWWDGQSSGNAALIASFSGYFIQWYNNVISKINILFSELLNFRFALVLDSVSLFSLRSYVRYANSYCFRFAIVCIDF